MNNEQFDRLLHSRLADHQVNPPPDVWAGIQNRRSKRIKSIWWIGGLVLLICSAGLYWLLPQSLNESASSVTVTENSQTRNALPHANYVSIKPVTEKSLAVNTHSFTGNTQVQNRPQAGKPVHHTNASSHPEVLNSGHWTAENHSTPTEELYQQNLLWLGQLNTQPPELNAVPAASMPYSPPALPSRLSLIITGGPLITEKHLSPKFNYPGDNKYILYRQEAETRNNAWSTSILLQIDFSKNFFIRTGFNYMSISEKIVMRYVKAQVEGVITDTIVGTRNEITSPEQLLSVSDGKDFTLLADYILRDKAEYRFASFPLLAGFTFDKSKFSFYASAGLALNFTSAYAGKILAPDSAYLFSIQNSSTSPFNQLSGFTFMSSAGIGFKVSDKFRLLFEPSYFRQLPDITKTEYRLTQRFSGYGLQAGVIYKL